MTIPLKALVLDLDDTLYSEISYLRSAYQFIATNLSKEPDVLTVEMLQQYYLDEDVFESLSKNYNVDKKILLDWYRCHTPNIKLYPNVLETLNHYSRKYQYGLITDGRSKTQRNKLQALGLLPYLNSIVISEEIGSEKPNLMNYKKVMRDLECKEYIYVGDNLKKDFITAKYLGWKTICLKDQGENIHRQDFSLAEPYHADYCFNSWYEIKEFLSLD